MARTKQEVRDFLNSLPGQMVNEKCGIYNGQCVSLIKALLDFLGAPSPYAGRGNAKDVGDTLVRQGIAGNAKGWLNVCINRDMGTLYEPSLGKYVNYGHIWLDLSGEANYEQNGSRALRTTKGTRPLTQAQQIVNLDQYITGEDNGIMNDEDAKEVYRAGLHREPENDQVWRGNVGKRFADVARSLRQSPEWLTQNHAIVFFTQREQQLNQAVAKLNDANTKLAVALQDDELDKKAVADAKAQQVQALKQLDIVTNNFNGIKKQLDIMEAEKQQAVETGNAFTRWLGEQLNKILGKK